ERFGVRGIRAALQHDERFQLQIQALLRAAPAGELRILLPFVTTGEELRHARALIAEIARELDMPATVPVGAMIEVPAAALTVDHIAAHADFLSVGTNDLIQYTLAVDRSNKEVAALYNACDPAVLRLIEMSIKAADGAGIVANMCGQMSGSTTYTQLLLGMGLRQFSVAPAAIPEIKRVCRAVTIDQCRQVAERAMAMESARAIKNYLRDELKKLTPEAAA
ncbi:MAG TPA: putative PEP-binding protein, partial [Pirellulales bacterium]|nr:putative PEP-binding protein [Pirellulales bacterium]